MDNNSRLYLTQSQQRAFDLYKNGCNLFVTGKGGTGKSFWTRHVIKDCHAHRKSVVVCAPTGIAAINVGGATIHRTFQAPVRIIEPHEYLDIKDMSDKDRATLDKKSKGYQEKLDVIRKADVIIIDEISMCRMDLFGFVARTLLRYEGKPKQIIVVGDFYQLPPVLSNDKREADAWQLIPEYAGKTFAFQAPEWNQLGILTVELTENMRQKDQAFIAALDNIREGIPNFTPFGSKQKPNPKAITLCPNNKMATSENEKQLGILIRRGARHRVYKESVAGFLKKADDRELEKYRSTGKQIELCIGARIIVLINSKNGSYANGDMGEVTALGDESIDVKLDNGLRVNLESYIWSIQEYQMVNRENENTGKKEKVSALVEIGTIKQIPVKLAWAISVHKSQGQTYDICNIMCGFWTEGQMYVALSRCRSLGGLRILGELQKSELMYSEKVIEFMRQSQKSQKNIVTKNKWSLASPKKSVIDVTEIKKPKTTKTATNPRGAGRKPKEDQTTVKKHLMRLTEQEKAYIVLMRLSPDFRNSMKSEYKRWSL